MMRTLVRKNRQHVHSITYFLKLVVFSLPPLNKFQQAAGN